MIDSNITYSKMISYAAQNIYKWCDNVKNKYSTLPLYVKEGYQLSGYIPINIPPVNKGQDQFIDYGGKPLVQWQISSTTAIPNSSSVNSNSIQTELTSYLGISSPDLNSTPTTNGLIWFLNGVGNFCKNHLKFYRQLFNVNDSAIINPSSVLPKTNTYLAYLLGTSSTPLTPSPANFSNEIATASTVNGALSSLMEAIKTNIPIVNIQYSISLRFK